MKKNKIKNFFTHPIFLFISTLCLILTSSIITHETTHGVIFKQYGCTNITYSYEKGNFYTDADCTQLTEYDKADVNFLQAQTELTQYPIILLGLIVYISCQLKLFEKNQ